MGHELPVPGSPTKAPRLFPSAARPRFRARLGPFVRCRAGSPCCCCCCCCWPVAETPSSRCSGKGSRCSGKGSRDDTMRTVAVRPGALDVARLPPSRLDQPMLELLCHPIPFVMRRVACDLRAPRVGDCEGRRENSACFFERMDGVVGCQSGLHSGSEELVAREVAGGMGGGSWLKNSAILGVKYIVSTSCFTLSHSCWQWCGGAAQCTRA